MDEGKMIVWVVIAVMVGLVCFRIIDAYKEVHKPVPVVSEKEGK